MKYPEFKLETYLADREFIAPFNLCASDMEAHSMQDIIQLADKDCLALWNELQLGYTESKGLPLLRDEICKEYGEVIDKEQILCFAGAEEGIYSMAHSLLEPKDHAIVITPCYQSLLSLPAAICSTTEVLLHYDQGWELDIEKIADAILPNTKLLLINFPHNPTGALISKKTQADLVALARKHDFWIFSDEVYRFLEVDPTSRLPPIASIYEKGISLNVMSKAFGLAGLRIGWVACQNKDLLQQMNETKHYLSICNSAPSEVLALIALRNQEKLLYKNRSTFENNLWKLDQFFDNHSDWFEWVRPKGGCIGYPLFKGNTPIAGLADDLLKQSGVLLLPGTVYHDHQNHFRISFGRKTMHEALDRLTQFIEINQRLWR